MGVLPVKTLFLSSILLLASLTIPPSALARLGEDEIQCEERYGFAKKEFVQNDKSFPLITGIGAITRTYLYQGWRIRIGFLDGVAVREEYWKVTGPGRAAAIADYERTPILEAEKGVGTWQPKGTKLTVNISKMLQDHLQSMMNQGAWIRSDGVATATLDMLNMRLSFESLAAVQHDEETKRGNEEKQRASVPAF